jgi:ABC-type proline/glycine betaine transport system permease subunit
VVDVNNGPKKTPSFEYQENLSKSPVAGIVLGIFSIILAVPTIGILGLILGIIGLINSNGAAGKTLNIIGIVFSGAVFLSLFLAAFGI